MENLKLVGYVLLSIVVIVIFFSVGALLSAFGFVLSLILTGAFFIGFVAFMIKTYLVIRNHTRTHTRT